MKVPPSFVHLGAVALVSSLLLGGTAQAQTATATTDPIGFITLNLPAGSVASGAALSFKSLGLARQVEYQGNAEAASGTTLTDADANWSDDQFNGASGVYYVEITGPANGAGIGTTYDVADTALASPGPGGTLTLSQPLAGGIAPGATFRLRKHWTIATIFGATNDSGLAAGTSTTADTIRILNAQGNYETYYYSNSGAPGTGWRKDGGGAADQANTVVYPDDGLVINRVSTNVANVVLMGAVKTGQTSYPVLAGLNIIGNPFATSMTLGDSGLYTGSTATGVAPGTATTADAVLIYNGATYDTYYYSNSGAPGTGWRKDGAGAADQAAVQIPMGAAILVQRRNGSPFNWVAPQHPATL